MRLEVPLFQRQYVWNREQQWEPLWEDIARKFVEYLEGRKDAPVHFLGAMVLDQKQTPSTHVERRQVIDGQQRLTTLQIFLAAFRDFCREQRVSRIWRKECDGFTLNKGMMADPGVDRFKVWPTQLDRPQFMDVIERRVARGDSRKAPADAPEVRAASMTRVRRWSRPTSIFDQEIRNVLPRHRRTSRRRRRDQPTRGHDRGVLPGSEERAAGGCDRPGAGTTTRR